MNNFRFEFDSETQSANEFTDFAVSVIRKWFEVAVNQNPEAGKVIMYDGSVVSLLDFTPDDFNPEHAFNILPNINRYNGNTYIPFSVGQHSLLCYNIAKTLFPEQKKLQLLCLTHDFVESIIGDCISPIKHMPIMAAFSFIEDHIEKAVLEKLRLTNTHGFYSEYIKKVDKIALTIEVKNLNKYSKLPIWDKYIYTDAELAEFFFLTDGRDATNASGINEIITMTPKVVETRLRNLYYNLVESINKH